MAARTVYDAVDAATAPSAGGAGPDRTQRSSRQAAVSASAVSGASVRRVAQATGRIQGSATAARHGVLAPVKRASRAVSLEVTGSFFALFALSFAAAAWRLRALRHSPAGQRLWVSAAFAALFCYFAVSSFLRARRVSKG